MRENNFNVIKGHVLFKDIHDSFQKIKRSVFVKSPLITFETLTMILQRNAKPKNFVSHELWIILLCLSMLAVSIQSELIRQTDLCYICDTTLAKTYNSSSEIDQSHYHSAHSVNTTLRNCYKYGTYDVFCHPSRTKPSKVLTYSVQGCESHFSIMPPRKNETNCHVNILDNQGSLQDVLTITTNGSATSTNNTWYIRSGGVNDISNRNYAIFRNIPSQLEFEGRKKSCFNTI